MYLEGSLLSISLFFIMWISQKVKRKIQGMPKSQVAANPWHQGEAAQTTMRKQKHEKRSDQPTLPKWGDRSANWIEKIHKDKTQDKTYL